MDNRKVRNNITGAFLILFHNGPHYYWGNLSIYLASYLVNRANNGVGQIHPGWAVFTYGPFWALSMLAGGYLNNYIHERLIIGASIVVLSCSFFVSYLMIDGSLNVLFFAFGALVGVGTGLSEGILLQHYVVGQSSRHPALLTGIALAGGPVGGVIIGQFATWFTNPENLTPDSIVQGMKVFTHDHIINKVPALMVILGGSTLTVQFAGLLMLRNSKPYGGCGIGKKVPEESYGTIAAKEATADQNCSQSDGAATSSNDSEPNYAPNVLLRSFNFYKLVIVNFLVFFPRIVVFTYYKIYGQLWIHDDHFLTYTGTGQSLMTIPASVAWGALLDRMSVRSTCVCMFSGMALSILLMYFTAMWSRWAFLVAALLAAATTQNCVIFMCSTLKFFGKNNLTSSIALVELVSLTGTLIPGLMFDSLIDTFGHFYEFACASVCSCLAVLIAVISFPS